MAKKVVTVEVSRWNKKPAKRIHKRRKLKSALKMIFNYMKSDSYMFAPLIPAQSSLSPPPVSSGEVSFTPMEQKEKKLIEDADEYLKCDAYMYALLVRDSAYEGTTNPCSDDEIETGGDGVRSSRDMEHDDPVRRRRIVVEQSERVKHILQQNSRSLSSTGEMLSQRKAVGSG